MFLKIDQSSVRCGEQLQRMNHTSRGSFAPVMTSLEDDRDRRRLAWCFAAEDAEAARNLAFGDLEPEWHAWLTRHEVGVAPIWTPGEGGAAGWGAAMSANSAKAFKALTELPESLRWRVREVTLAVPRAEATAVVEHAERCYFPALYSLDCQRCDSSIAVALVGHTPTLTRVVANAARSPDALLAALAERNNIRALGLYGEALGDSVAGALAELPLQRLALATFDMTKDVADVLGRCPELESLEISEGCSYRLKKANFKRLLQHLVKGGRLRELKLDGSFRLIDGKALMDLEQLSALRSLRVNYGNGSASVDGSFVSKLQALDLRDLTLRKVVLRASDVEKIGAMANLRRAYLGFNEVNLDPVATLPKLAVLHVEGGITSAALPTLCSNPNLFRLRIHLDRDGEQALAKAPVPVGLRELELDSVSLSAKGAAALAEWPLAGLSACSGAMFGRPVTAQLGSDGAKELARCKTLEWLNVGAHDIGPDGAKALGTLPRLRWLHMPGNPIGAGVSGFAQAPALRVAYLNNCGLPPETPKWLGQVATLEEAYLWNNAIDGSHLDEFAKLPKLRELNLANNPVAPAAAEDLRRLAPHVKIVAPRPGAPDPTAGLANTAVVTINGGAFRPGSGS